MEEATYTPAAPPSSADWANPFGVTPVKTAVYGKYRGSNTGINLLRHSPTPQGSTSREENRREEKTLTDRIRAISLPLQSFFENRILEQGFDTRRRSALFRQLTSYRHGPATGKAYFRCPASAQGRGARTGAAPEDPLDGGSRSSAESEGTGGGGNTPCGAAPAVSRATPEPPWLKAPAAAPDPLSTPGREEGGLAGTTAFSGTAAPGAA